MSLETNLGLKAQKLTPQMAAEDLATARAAFNPSVTSSFQRNTTDQQATSVFQSASSTVTSNTTGASAGLSQVLPWNGSTYSFGWNTQRSVTNAFSTFNPQLASQVTATFTQPLLRGFLVDNARQAVKTSQRALEIADVGLRQQALTTEHNVRTAYLNLIGAIANRAVAQENLDVSQASRKNTQSRVDVGTMAPNDIFAADADVAANEQRLIAAESAITTAQDALRVLVVDPARPDYWSVTIVPSDTVQLVPRQIDVEAAVKNALANRTDLITERKQIEITDLNTAVLRDSTKTSVNFQVQYSANGVAGTQIEYGSTFPPTVLGEVSRGYGGALADTFTNTNPSWTYGVQVAHPLGTTAQEAQLARSRLNRQQLEILLHNDELQVATAVRGAARQVDTLYKQVQALVTSREAQEHNLDAEQKKFAVGLSSTFNLFSIQRDLAAAKLSELQAKIAYNQALIDFEAVQRIR